MTTRHPERVITCTHCGKGAVKRAPNARFCSSSCAQRWSYLQHKERDHAKWRRYYYRNRERLIEKTLKYIAAHPERSREINNAAARRYKDTPKGRRARVKADMNRRVRSMAERAGTIDMLAWERKIRACGSRCQICGIVGKMTIDHIVPLKHGGTNDIRNLQPLCLRCNKRKGTRILTGAQLILI